MQGNSVVHCFQNTWEGKGCKDCEWYDLCREFADLRKVVQIHPEGTSQGGSL